METFRGKEVAFITGLATRRIAFLVDHGLCAAIDDHPGRGKSREYSLGQVWRITLAAELNGLGISPTGAHRVLSFIEKHGKETWAGFDQLAEKFDLLMIGTGDNAPVMLVKGRPKAVCSFLTALPFSLVVSLPALVKRVHGRMELVRARR